MARYPLGDQSLSITQKSPSPLPLVLSSVPADPHHTTPFDSSPSPIMQSPIAVAGYPVGGDSLSITKGIVSRLTLVRYSAAVRLLGIQVRQPAWRTACGQFCTSVGCFLRI